MEGYEMAISPNEPKERRGRRLKERDRRLKALDLDKVANYFGSEIDKQLGELSVSHGDTTTVRIEAADFDMFVLSQEPSIAGDLKQRYIEKGWQDVKFKCVPGDEYNNGFIAVEFVYPGITTVPDFVKVILFLAGLSLLGWLFGYFYASIKELLYR